ncbi:L-aspartate oxidase [Aeribacillus composti]|uniref:L-aspartate oxidase n=1 Tax=Aeribacillus composti TaxID=1868734 RepID=A0ABY9W7Z0_9BACI|nr:L-aspartate oxidase [Aeribacillus composti]WNF32255.1 L-aspartate oxidase [Aeribacillus composti]
MTHYDVIIVGSGIAALTVASELCEKMNILMITKTMKTSSNSHLAQGGIACAIHENDHSCLHYEDTLYAGRYHNKKEAVELLVQEGKEIISSLMDEGFPFDKDEQGNVDLGNEGAHSFRRILHAGGDATGRKMVEHFLKKITNRITINEYQFVCDVVVKDGRAVGIITKTADENIHVYTASHIILATGGCGQAYEWTSNHPNATGDGLAIAFRAGCRLIDMEFTQFHPTMLYINGTCRGLISEAVRGEGAVLIDETGQRFMSEIHPLGDLAPRDVVARAIYRKYRDGHQVYLDISEIQFFSERFPTIAEMCWQNRVNLSEKKIPVVPGMHFLMGGIETDLVGRTNIDRLYAVGELACTGVHGANRLASNSLLEGLVFGKRIAKFILDQWLSSQESFGDFHWNEHEKTEVPEKGEIRKILTKWVGIERTHGELAWAVSWLKRYVKYFPLNAISYSIEEIERINMITAGYLIAKGALLRKESRGGHFRIDYPGEKPEWLEKRIVQTNEQRIGAVET